MSRRHLTEELMDAVWAGRLPTSRLLALLFDHLVGCCPTCRRAFDAWRTRQLPPDGYAGSVEGLRDDLRRRADQIARERLAAREWRDELLPLAPDERLGRIRRARKRFRGGFFIQELLEASRTCLPGDPQGSFQLARAALEATRRSSLAEGQAPALLAQARALMGNARRAQGDLQQAERHLAAARHEVESGAVADVLVRAEVDALEGVLRKDQRRFPAAEALLNRAVLLYGAAGESVKAAQELIALAPLYDLQGHPERAAEVTLQALESLHPEETPRLYLFARYNLAYYLHSAGRHQEAVDVLAGDAELYRRCQDPALVVRLRWLQGKLAFALGDPAEAEEAFLEARAYFEAQGQAFNFAAVCLDLALLHLDQGRCADLRRVAADAADYFAAQAVHREALAALTLFRQAAEAQALTATHVHRLARYLEQARADPALTFGPPD